MNFDRYQAQAALFAVRPLRKELQQLELDAMGSRKVGVNVWRNHAIESVITLTMPYLAYGRYSVDFRLSDYDDTLMFRDRQPAELELLWLDSTRYLDNSSFEDFLEWLVGRIRALRTASAAPIVVATWLPDSVGWTQLQALVDAIPAIHLADLNAICTEAGVKLAEPRTAAMAGTLVSNAAQPLLARELACHWLPAAVFPPIKAVVLDLDNTLHAGVLGEDGIQGVQLTAAHQALQHFTKTLQQRGVFIALLSRNERVDVERLFEQRDDYPLRWDDFSVIEISWGDKGVAIERIAKALRIASDSILFVDDNPGELASVVAQLPQVHTVYASADASLTQRTIEYYPGLWRWKLEADDVKRVQDLKSNAERDAILMESTDTSDYFRGLQTTLIFRCDPHDQLSRLADLCNKTNQFNLAMRRFSHAELAERLERSDACVVSVQMSDRLSDSGVIAVIVAERGGEQLIIEELCISCRAMGRQLEDTIILEAIGGMAQLADCSEVSFRVQVGPRNQPALDWLARLLRSDLRPSSLLYAVPVEVVRNFVPPDGIKLVKE